MIRLPLIALPALFALTAAFSTHASAQSSAAPGVSPAASVASGGQADVHLSAATTSPKPAWAKFASNTGNLLFLGAGTFLPLAEDGKQGPQHSLRTADSLITATLITEGLKRIAREKRPDANSRDSFPSGHATAAFAVATMQAHYHPNQAIFWYAGASAIAYSRVKLRRHYTRDILAGAAVGIVTARVEISQSHGLLLFPFIHADHKSGGNGIGVSMNF